MNTCVTGVKMVPSRRSEKMYLLEGVRLVLSRCEKGSLAEGKVL